MERQEVRHRVHVQCNYEMQQDTSFYKSLMGLFNIHVQVEKKKNNKTNQNTCTCTCILVCLVIFFFSAYSNLS